MTRLVLAAAWLFLFAACKQEEIDLPTGFRGEARSNPLLAAERTLRELGFESETRARLLPLPDAGLVTVGRPLFANESAVDELLRFVEEGGHAAVLLDGFPGFGDIFDGLDDWDEFEEDSSLPPDHRLRSALEKELDVYRVALGDVDDEAFDTRTLGGHLLDFRSESGWLRRANDEASPGLRMELGRGALWLLPDGSPLDNRNLGDGDGAYWLADFAEAAGGVTFVLGEGDTLAGLLRSRAPYALLAAALLLVLWLWRSSARFGPIETFADDESEGFVRHVAASGRYLWQQDHGAALLRALRARVLRVAAARHPAAQARGEDALLEELAERHGMSVPAVTELLRARGALRSNELVEHVNDLIRMTRET